MNTKELAEQFARLFRSSGDLVFTIEEIERWLQDFAAQIAEDKKELEKR